LGAYLPEILIWTILRWERKVAIAALEALNIDCVELEAGLDSVIRKKDGIGSRTYSEPVSVAKAWGRRESRLLGMNYVGTEHLLLAAIAEADNDFLSFLKKNGIDYAMVKSRRLEILGQ
jgi:ATP-dependent Clp protease ATP-binding subunit ClpA